MKSSNVKKVLSIVILCIVVAVTLATIILAVVPKNLYNPISEGYYAITVYKNKESNLYRATENASEEEKTVIEKIKNLQAKSVRDNVLSALFQGTGNFQEEVLYESTVTNAMDKVANVENSVCLIYNYLDEQTLMMNDKACTHEKATGEGKTIVYTKLFMQITNNDEFDVCTVYLTGSDNKSNYRIQFLAHQSVIYDYLTNLNWDVV